MNYMDSDYGIRLESSSGRYSTRADLISKRMSQYYQGNLDWQDEERTAKESTGEYGQNLDGVWGWTTTEARQSLTNDEMLDRIQNADGSSMVSLHIRSNSEETLVQIRDAVASMVPKYCGVHKAHVRNNGDDWGWNLTIHYADAPTYKMGEFNETGVKRASKIIPALRAVLSEGDY